MKLLIGIPSPRDIPQFLEATTKLNYDKFWARYFHEYEAFRLIHDFFLEHKEYSHLAILCDDLIVTQRDADTLFQEAIANDYPVLGGLCPVNRDECFDGMVNISLTHTTNPDRKQRRYEFMTIKQWEEYPRPKPTVQTKWQGFPFSIIQRDIIERFEFKTDGFYNNKPGRGCCTDNVFNWELAKAGIPMYSNLNVYMHHMPDRFQHFGVGIKEPYTRLEIPIMPEVDV